MAHKVNKLEHCPNCNTALGQEFEYCPKCGQANHDIKVPFSHLGYEFIEGFTHFDTNAWNTLKSMFTAPGKITQEYLDGKRARYVPPPRYYIFISVIFFLLLGTLVNNLIAHELDHNKLKDEITIRTKDSNYIMSPRKWFYWLQMHESKSDSFLLANDNPTTKDVTSLRDSVYKSLSSYIISTKKEYNKGKKYDDENNSSPIKIKTQNDDNNELWISQSRLDSVYTKKITPLKVTADYYALLFDKKITKKELQELKHMSSQQLDSLLRVADIPQNFVTRNFLKRFEKFKDLDINGIAPLAIKSFSMCMFILMPLIAFLTWIFFRKKRKYYVEHLVYSIHMHSFVFTVYSLVLLFLLITHVKIPEAIYFGLLLALAIYFIISIKRVFESSLAGSILKFIMISSIYFILSSLLSVVSILYGAISF